MKSQTIKISTLLNQATSARILCNAGNGITAPRALASGVWAARTSTASS